MAILFPVVSNVNRARLKVLSLFVDIPNYHVITLANKCENFIGTFHEEHNDEIESEEGDANKNEENESSSNNLLIKRGGHK